MTDQLGKLRLLCWQARLIGNSRYAIIQLNKAFPGKSLRELYQILVKMAKEYK